mmetsp:Transcript_38735/g.114830  ORF Transcript_38735/g.114830 Transcript_38735/m.114830 type:complete len:246 (+) Transcript_38735:346-1083(+)
MSLLDGDGGAFWFRAALACDGGALGRVKSYPDTWVSWSTISTGPSLVHFGASFGASWKRSPPTRKCGPISDVRRRLWGLEHCSFSRTARPSASRYCSLNSTTMLPGITWITWIASPGTASAWHTHLCQDLRKAAGFLATTFLKSPPCMTIHRCTDATSSRGDQTPVPGSASASSSLAIQPMWGRSAIRSSPAFGFLAASAARAAAIPWFASPPPLGAAAPAVMPQLGGGGGAAMAGGPAARGDSW